MSRDLEQLLQEEVSATGFEVYDWSMRSAGKRGKLLLVTIHSDKGVNLDDCAAVSRAVARALDEVELIESRFILDVSSPGLDRPLMRPRHFEIAKGRLARIQVQDGETGRTLEGLVGSLIDGVLEMELPEGVERIPLESISKARLVPQFPARKREAKERTGGKK